MMRFSNLIRAVLLFGAFTACNKSSETVVDTKPKVDPILQHIGSSTWVGLLHQTPSELRVEVLGTVANAHLTYTVFGRTVLKDEFTLTADPDGTVHLKPAAGNKFVGNGKFLAELTGKLSEDKNTLSGNQPLGEQNIAWSFAKGKAISEVDPPMSLLSGEAALTTTPWEGTVGGRPARLTITKTSAGLNATLQQGKETTKFDAALNAKGELKLTATARPTQQGLLKVTVNAFFSTREMNRLQGTAEISTTQGFVEQSSSEGWTFIKAKPESAAKPAKAGAKKKKKR